MEDQIATVLKKLREYSYLPKWYFSARLFGKRAPLQTVLFITDYCNLKCKHCAEDGHACTTSKSYGQIREELEYSYRAGSRFVDLEGGEPTLWRDQNRGINDLVRLAKKTGFFTVTVTTNAQRPFRGLEADSVWVSLDGYRSYHDEIRGPGAFKLLEENVAACGHPSVSFNMAVNRLNYRSVPDVIRYTKANPHVRQISINFHTPYPGTEELALDRATRARVIDAVLAMKRAGYPVMNSASGLSFLKKKEFSRQCWISNFILVDGTRLDACPGKGLGICRECGFSMAGEMHSVFALRPDTLLAGWKLRMKP